MGSGPGFGALSGRRVGVWGTGREGMAITRLALDRGASVLVVQDRPADGAQPSDIRIGDKLLQVLDPSALDPDALDIVVRSPGVSRYRPELERLRQAGISVTTATAMWFEDSSDLPVIGVTGSKGKTMTASLTALALRSTGLSVGLGGNIGTPVTDFFEGPSYDAYVIEVSSFQAAEVTSSPQVGVLTLLAPDHLDWHGTYERYVTDKLNLFGHRADIELAVNARSAEAKAAAGGITTGERLHLYGADGPVQVVRNGGYGLVVDGAEVPELSGLPIRGKHNFDNLCGAITATRILTGSLPDFSNLAGLIAEMPVLPSRLTTFAIAGGVEFVDDALASNPAGAIAALEAFEGRRVSLIAGGHVRGTEFRLLAEALEAKNAADGATLVHLGDAGRRLVDELEAISSQVPRLSAKDMAQAVTLAATAVSGTGGVVLFSPGAPTPPSEGTYVERGAEFRRAVELVVAPIAERDLAGTC